METSEHIRSIEVEGVALDVDVRRLEDVRFTYALAKVSADETPEAERLVWYARMLDTLFGGGAYRVMCELAGDGQLTGDRWNAFFNAVLAEVGRKN